MEKALLDGKTAFWLVVFCDPEPLTCAPGGWKDRFLYHCLHRFLRPGFRHVFALRRAHGFEGWLLVNPHSACLDILELVGDSYVDFLIQSQAKGNCTLCIVPARRALTWQPRGVFSCVSVIAHMIGVSDFILTPWQFYKTLRKDYEMGGLFSSPKPPDTSAAERRAAQAEKERDRLKKENEARIRNRRNRARGRSLLAFSDTGLQGVPGKKTKLGE